jgi:hypothetical protein
MNKKIHNRIEETEVCIDMELEWDNIKSLVNYRVYRVLEIDINWRNSGWFDCECRESYLSEK